MNRGIERMIKLFEDDEIKSSYINIVGCLRKTYNKGKFKSSFVTDVAGNGLYMYKLHIDRDNISVNYEELGEEYVVVYFEKDGKILLPYDAKVVSVTNEYKTNSELLNSFGCLIDNYETIEEELKMIVNLQNIPDEIRCNKTEVKLKALGKYYK